MRRRDGLFKSLHCVENNDWESWSVGWEECSYHECFSFESIVSIIMTVYELCSNHSDNECVRMEMDWIVTHGVAHQPLDRCVSIVDREWVNSIIRIMDRLMKWLGYKVNRDIRLLIVMNDSIRFVNWVFSDSWLSMCIQWNKGNGD